MRWYEWVLVALAVVDYALGIYSDDHEKKVACNIEALVSLLFLVILRLRYLISLLEAG